MMKQKQYQPLSVAEIAISFFLVDQDQGLLDDVDVKKVVNFAQNLLQYMREEQADLLKEINQNPVYTNELAQRLRSIVEQFKKSENW